MKITALVENTSKVEGLEAMHGLSLYIETVNHKLLVDVGNSGLFLKNAQKLGIDMSKVDTVIITHGHSDHGGSLKDFFNVNNTAKVYIQNSAFLPHYTKALRILKINIGLDATLLNHPQVILLDQNHKIDDELTLIVKPDGKEYMPKFNSKLLEKDKKALKKDEFNHEQSLIIAENKTVLIGGCAHRGIINILKQAKAQIGKDIDVCISGFHLFNPAAQISEDDQTIVEIAGILKQFPTKFHTCHCTGLPAYNTLKQELQNQINYLSTGQTLEI